MSKRFIDTGLFDDDWFMDLSKDGKLLWIFLITKCDHAGMIKINSKLIKFHTGINNFDETIKELSKSLVTVSEQLIFIPKYIFFQYPGFPKSNVRQQDSALKILKSFNLIKDDNLTLNIELANSYGNGNVSVNVNDNVKELNISFETFWNLYDKKKDKPACEERWKCLTDEERTLIIDYIPEYKNATEKQFRKDPIRFLKKKSWLDEIIIKEIINPFDKLKIE
jgi:hypothetical protein